eukprot:7935116-Alexandrium_andersonii.AAC.1
MCIRDSIATLRAMRNRSMSGTERSTSARRPTPRSLDRPAQEQTRAADGEQDPADRDKEGP